MALQRVAEKVFWLADLMGYAKGEQWDYSQVAQKGFQKVVEQAEQLAEQLVSTLVCETVCRLVEQMVLKKADMMVQQKEMPKAGYLDQNEEKKTVDLKDVQLVLLAVDKQVYQQDHTPADEKVGQKVVAQEDFLDEWQVD